jgi:isoprenylcysteine carboxyl methyltransferase (ICMT) family protein YpbQ
MILASDLPSDDGYVVAAYLVFLALLLVYLVIMAVRLSRVERELIEMNRDE